MSSSNIQYIVQENLILSIIPPQNLNTVPENILYLPVHCDS